MSRISYAILSIIVFTCLLVGCDDGATTGPSSHHDGVFIKNNDTVYESIREAISAAEDGDTLLLSGGLYTGAKNTNLIWDASVKHLTITVLSHQEPAVIDCHGCSGFYFENSHQSPEDVIDGLIIKNAGKPFNAGIYCEGVAPTIRNCVIEDCDYAGIYCERANPHIIYSTIEDNKVGVLCAFNARPFITLSIIRSNDLESVYGVKSSYPEITNCLIEDNERGIHMLEDSKVTVANTTIVDNKQYGIKIGSETISTVVNSIFWNNGKSFELIYGNALRVSYSCAQQSIPAVNPVSAYNIYDDPQFVSNSDFHLRAGSPCIDVGATDSTNVDVDLDGNNRVNNEIVDIGAYEWYE